MSKEAAQIAESAPADYKQYLSMKDTSEAPTAQSPVEEKAAPESDPVDPPQEKPKGLTDEEKSERKRRNEERRAQRWYEERGEMRAKMQAMEQELAGLKETRTQSPSRSKTDGKPTLRSFLESGEYKTFEEANEAFTEALTDYKLTQKEQEREVEKIVNERQSIMDNFAKRRSEYEKTHSDFNDAFDEVAKTLEGPNGEGTPVTEYLLKAKDGHELIHHLGNNPELLDSIVDLPFDEAIAELGALRKDLKSSPVQKETTPALPKAPRNLGARNVAPRSHEEVMRKAAEQAVTSGNPSAGFKEYLAASRAKQKANQ